MKVNVHRDDLTVSSKSVANWLLVPEQTFEGEMPIQNSNLTFLIKLQVFKGWLAVVEYSMCCGCKEGREG